MPVFHPLIYPTSRFTLLYFRFLYIFPYFFCVLSLAVFHIFFSCFVSDKWKICKKCSEGQVQPKSYDMEWQKLKYLPLFS